MKQVFGTLVFACACAAYAQSYVSPEFLAPAPNGGAYNGGARGGGGARRARGAPVAGSRQPHGHRRRRRVRVRDERRGERRAAQVRAGRRMREVRRRGTQPLRAGDFQGRWNRLRAQPLRRPGERAGRRKDVGRQDGQGFARAVRGHARGGREVPLRREHAAVLRGHERRGGGVRQRDRHAHVRRAAHPAPERLHGRARDCVVARREVRVRDAHDGPLPAAHHAARAWLDEHPAAGRTRGAWR